MFSKVFLFVTIPRKAQLKALGRQDILFKRFASEEMRVTMPWGIEAVVEGRWRAMPFCSTTGWMRRSSSLNYA
ncbi:hypothetical protein [Devosia yakushimensis]|uniref:hypothetical protein n=1 Tax=Devosia yakushimensis TaxID=470028 RepID=UPI0024E0C0A6|nr:hypothetical protein [Devosia yakushimensis]